MKRLRQNWEIAIWSCCMFLGGAMLVSQMSLATRADELEYRLARRAVDAVLEETGGGGLRPVAEEPLKVSMARPEASKRVVRPDARRASDLFIDAIIQVESAGNARQVGRSGERGLMQIKAKTWAHVTRELYGRKLSFDQAFDPAVNKAVGAAYLASLQEFLVKHRGQWKADERSLLLACYNAGPDKVRRSGFCLRRLPRSTQDYVQRATALHDDFLRQSRAQLASL